MVSILPQPVSIERRHGRFLLSSRTVLQADAAVHRAAETLARRLLPTLGVLPRIADAAVPMGSVVRILISPAGPVIPAEGYHLSVTRDCIDITARDEAGVFHAGTTLLQLLPPEALAPAAARGGSGAVWRLPCVEVVDHPRFSWRGLMLDTARHFFPVEFVKRYIEQLSFHKMNVFHWHLTEDQGWRIESRRHPELTDIGAWRSGTLVRYGGFYTQEQVREVVAFAAERHVTVVPEIEMPGHCLAALAAHPELSCTGGPFAVSPIWGVREDVFCAGNDAVFTLLEDVIDEVLPLFPSPFFHVGGDECPKVRWKACPKCQARMRAEGLADEDALQSWFIRRIERIVNARGKRLVGWDEILEGGLAPNATVMSWRGVEGGIEAARQGHDVVMSPTTHCYLDYRQSEQPDREPPAIDAYLPLEKVYSYEPVPSELAPEQGQHVLGVQGNLWTEYVPTPEHAEYMSWPRACALAEAGWSTAGVRGWKDFRRRLGVHLGRLDALGVKYRALDR